MLAGKVCESRCWLLRYYWATGHSGNYWKIGKSYQDIEYPFKYIPEKF